MRLPVQHLPPPLPLRLSPVCHGVQGVTNVTCDNVVTRRVTTFLRGPVTMAIDGARDDEKCVDQVVSAAATMKLSTLSRPLTQRYLDTVTFTTPIKFTWTRSQYGNYLAIHAMVIYLDREKLI